MEGFSTAEVRAIEILTTEHIGGLCGVLHLNIDAVVGRRGTSTSYNDGRTASHPTLHLSDDGHVTIDLSDSVNLHAA